MTQRAHGAENITRYLADPELVGTGFTQLDDLPESYLSWQSSFISAIMDLDLLAANWTCY